MTVVLLVLLLVAAVVAVVYGLGGFSCDRYRREGLLLIVVAALVFAPALLAQQAAPPSGTARAFDGGALVAGLKATPGCLGVELARTASGKQVIFAWFENKAAVLAWYTSATHVHAMQMVFPGHEPSASALKDIPDDTPVLTIASVTMADPAKAAPGAPPFTQIAIEHYTPLAGGIAVGGRFAPSALKVPGLREGPLTPQTTVAR